MDEARAHAARLHILGEMAKAIDTPGALEFDPSTKALIERALAE